MYDKTKFSMLNIDDFFSSDQYQTIEDFSYADVQGIGKVVIQFYFFIFQIALRHYQLKKLRITLF